MARPARMRRASAENDRPTDGGRSSQRILEDAADPRMARFAADPRIARFAGDHGSLHPGLQQLVRLLARRTAQHSRRGLGFSPIEVVLPLLVLALLLLALSLLSTHFSGP